jgi:hypothetical protein
LPLTQRLLQRLTKHPLPGATQREKSPEDAGRHSRFSPSVGGLETRARAAKSPHGSDFRTSELNMIPVQILFNL